MPRYKEEFLDITNANGEPDRLLLLHIEASADQVIRTTNDSTFLRIGDRTKELKGEDLRNLEYAKSTRHFEDECNMDAQIEDLDADLIMQRYFFLQKIFSNFIQTAELDLFVMMELPNRSERKLTSLKILILSIQYFESLIKQRIS